MHNLAAKCLKIIAASWMTIIVTLIAFGVTSGTPGALTWGPTNDFWAMSMAVSKVKFGLSGYRGYPQISQVLANHLSASKTDTGVNDEATKKLVSDPSNVEAGINAVSRMTKADVNPSLGYITSDGEDLGYVDFYAWSFRLFGYSELSTHHFYVFVLALSSLLFFIRFNNNQIKITILMTLITGIFIASNSGIMTAFLPNISANRFLSTLGIIPLFCCVFEAISEEDFTIRNLLIFIAQVFLLLFSISARSSAGWMTLAFLVIVFIYYLLNVNKNKIYKNHLKSFIEEINSLKINMQGINKISSHLILCIFLLIAIIISSGLYKKFQMDRMYSDGTGNHLVWHSAALGLAQHPDWINNLPIERLRGVGGDAIAVFWSEDILKERGISIYGSSSGPSKLNIKLHEKTLRWEILKFIFNHPKYALELYLYYKPIQAWVTVKEQVLAVKHEIWFSAVVTILIGLLAVSISMKPVQVLAAASIFSLVYAFSYLPVIWAYSTGFVMADQLTMNITAAMIVLILALYLPIALCTFIFKYFAKKA